MLNAHFAAVEQGLLALSRIPANAGHALHLGTPREAFVRSFLANHISERVAVGTGEIIDANSRPQEARNQHDVGIFKRDYPRLDFGAGISAFLAESVVATIEVKSTLREEDIIAATDAAVRAKALRRNQVQVFTAGYQPPSILSYVVAYDGPARMETLRDWVHRAMVARGLQYPDLPVEDAQRVRVPSVALDAAFLLGRGFLYFDNVPTGLLQEQRREHPVRWVYGNSEATLLLLWLFLTTAISGVSGAWLNPLPYLAGVNFTNVSWAGPTGGAA